MIKILQYIAHTFETKKNNTTVKQPFSVHSFDLITYAKSKKVKQIVK